MACSKNVTAVMASVLALMGSVEAALADDALHVAWFGGSWGEGFRACVAEPFTKATGIAVVPEVGTSTVTLSKLQQQKDAPTIDVAWMDGGVSELAGDAGVVDNLDPEAIPNLKSVLPQAIYKKGDVNYAVGTGYFSVGLTYNTQEIKTPPISWNDLWKPEFADLVTIPSPSNSSGVPFIVFLSNIWGFSTSDLAPTFAKLKELKAALYFDSSGAATNAFQNKEAIIGAHFSIAAWDMIDKGQPIAFVTPKEGVWANDSRLHLVKNTARKAQAQKFIDIALTPSVAACLAEKAYLGPSLKDVTVPAPVARKLPWGEHGSVANLRLFDWNEVNARRAAIVDTWNREIARK